MITRDFTLCWKKKSLFVHFFLVSIAAGFSWVWLALPQHSWWIACVFICGFVVLNVIVQWANSYFFSRFFSEKPLTILLKSIRLSVGILWGVCVVGVLHFFGRFPVHPAYIFWGGYVLLFLVLYLTMDNYRGLYTDRNMFPDACFSRLFTGVRVKRIRQKEESRNVFVLPPGSARKISLPPQSFTKYGLAVSKQAIITDQQLQVQRLTKNGTITATVDVSLTVLTEGWHDFTADTVKEKDLDAVVLKSNSTCPAFISCRQVKQKNAPGRYVVLVVIDALAPAHIGLYQNDTSQTPNINEFFSQPHAMICREAFTQAEWTLPAFASMVTSLYPSYHKIVDPNKYGRVLPREKPVLAEIMQENGFATFGYVSHSRCGYQYGYFRGFDEFVYRQIKQGVLHSYKDITERALAFLKENPREDKFLFLHYFDTHKPFFPALNSSFHHGQDEKIFRAIKIKEVDAGLAPLFAILQNEEVSKNSLVIVTSDHGPGGFRESQGEEIDVKESNTKVPFLMSCPWKTTSFTENRSMVEANIDIMPTIIDALSLPSVESLQGRSIFNNKTRKNYAVSESIYKEKYELVQRGLKFKNYVRLSRDRRRDRINVPQRVEDCIKTYSEDGIPVEARVAKEEMIRTFLSKER